MNRLFKKFLNREEKRKEDIEKIVGRYLLELPQCDQNVVVMCSEYEEPHYTCNITVSASDLLVWAENNSKTFVLDLEFQAAIKALPIWLRGASNNTNQPSYLNKSMQKVVTPYAHNFINKDSCKIHCYDCNTLVTNIDVKKFDERMEGSWTVWTESWECPKGHQLYRQDHEMHIQRRY